MLEAGRFNGRSLSDPTNAQFTLQPFNHYPGSGSEENNPNLHRFTIPDNPKTITVVMQWAARRHSVTITQYNGAVTLKDLKKATPAVAPWTTDADQDDLIPDNNDQTVHFNLWRSGGTSLPESERLTVSITNFEYTKQIVDPKSRAECRRRLSCGVCPGGARLCAARWLALGDTQSWW